MEEQRGGRSKAHINSTHDRLIAMARANSGECLLQCCDTGGTGAVNCEAGPFEVEHVRDTVAVHETCRAAQAIKRNVGRIFRERVFRFGEQRSHIHAGVGPTQSVRIDS